MSSYLVSLVSLIFYVYPHTSVHIIQMHIHFLASYLLFILHVSVFGLESLLLMRDPDAFHPRRRLVVQPCGLYDRQHSLLLLCD